MLFCLASCRKIKQDDAVGSNQGNRCNRAEEKRHSPILSILFGTEGGTGGNALKAQRKALRTSTLSLTLSFMGFTMMLCFFLLPLSTPNTLIFSVIRMSGIL